MNLSRRSLLQALAALPGCAALARGSSEPETPATTMTELMIRESGKRPYLPYPGPHRFEREAIMLALEDIEIGEPLDWPEADSRHPKDLPAFEAMRPWDPKRPWPPGARALENAKKGERVRVLFMGGI